MFMSFQANVGNLLATIHTKISRYARNYGKRTTIKVELLTYITRFFLHLSQGVEVAPSDHGLTTAF